MELKIAFLLIIVGISSAFSAPSYSQTAKVSLDMKDKSLEQVMDEIEKQSEFYFIFNQKQIDVSRKVDIWEEDKLISDILPDLFKGTNVNYAIIDRKILLTTEPIEGTIHNVSSLTVQQQNNITGRVTDSKGKPLIGVNVILKGTTIGAITDINGKYALVLPNLDGILAFSFIGFTALEVPINGKSMIDAQLVEELTSLSEVVVTALGIKREAKSIG